MTDTEYVDGVQSEEYIETLLNKLLDLGVKNVILTGVSFEENKIGAACIGEDRKPQYYFNEKIPENYHGTGDVFASAFSGALLRGNDEYESARIAADYTLRCIENSVGDENHKYGAKFETAIPYLIELLNK